MQDTRTNFEVSSKVSHRWHSGVSPWIAGSDFASFLFSNPTCYVRPSFSLPLLVVTQIRVHIAASRLFSPPPLVARIIYTMKLILLRRLSRTPVLFFPALCPYLLRLRVSPVQQLSVPLQHICCSSCNLSDLASHCSELLSAFFCFSYHFSYFSGLTCFVVFSYQVR